VKVRILLFLACLSLASCSIFSSSDETANQPTSAPATKEPIQESSELEPLQFNAIPSPTPAATPTIEAEPASPKLSDVEIVWEIPREPVSKYIIYYGPSSDQLDKQVTVNTNDLEQLDDAAAGFVYRYDLKGIPNNQRLFVSISSVTATGESVRSAPIEVK
jgi:hypothetical protein